MGMMQITTCETTGKLNSEGRSSADKGSPSSDSSKKVSTRSHELMAKLRENLLITDNLLNNMLGSSSVMYTSRDKEDTAIETIHRESTKKIVRKEEQSPKLPADEYHSNSLYETATGVLDSTQKNKHAMAFELFVKASELGHIPSKLKLAWGAVLGYFNLSLEEAKKTFVELADSGEPEAHMALGFLHSTGLTEQGNQARALVHYMLGALGGNVWAQIILGYRYKSGISVMSNCEKSLQFYELAANEVVKRVSLSGGALIHRVRLIDLEENGDHNSYMLESDLVQYYEYLASKGDINAQVSLGQLYYHGLRGCPKDVRKSEYYFIMAVKKDNSIAMGYLGRIYLEDSESIKANNVTALNFFKQAAEKNNPIGWSGLGLIYMEGRGVEIDLVKARLYFSKAADSGWVEGQLNLGVMFMNGLGVTKDYKMALKYFHLAAQSGHVLAYYHLARMHAAGYGILRSCPTAVELFKNVAERGKWSEYLVTGSGKYQTGQYAQAFLLYALLSELGYEVAQANAAFMLENGLSGLAHATQEETYFRAFNYWRRAAQQGYSLAHIKIGDYYYYGQGVPQDYEAAANQYRLASNQFGNAQALFNIGYMHERGLGMPKDLVLAKRFYDLAAAVSPDASIPVHFALIKLTIVMAIDYIVTEAPSFYVAFWKRWNSTPWDLYALVFLLVALWVLVRRRAT